MYFHIRTVRHRLMPVIAGSLLLLSSGLLFSFNQRLQQVTSFWNDLGISQAQGESQIKNSFLRGYFDFYAARKATSILAGNRAAVARDLLQYTGSYVESPAFLEQYQQERMQARPTPPETSTPDKETIRKEKIAETSELIEKTKAILKTAGPELKKAMEEVLEMHQQNLTEYQQPESAMIDLFYQSAVMAAEQNQQSYKESVVQWETHYPADVRLLLKERLQRYLQLAATVNFDASLVERNGKRYFSDANYERKPAEWKMIFRAGREVYSVAKPVAEQWMKSLP